MHNTHPHHHLYSKCKSHMNKYVLVETNDGQQFDGIIVDVDVDQVILAIPDSGADMMYGQEHYMMDQRVFGYGYGYPYYGYPGRRFRRLALPLAALTAISLLPWFY